MARIMQVVKTEVFLDLFTWGGILWFAGIIVGAVLVTCTGCSPAGDVRWLGVPSDLTPVQHAAVQDAVDQWCAADLFCPTVIDTRPGERAQGEIVLDTDAAYAEFGRQANSAAFTDTSARTITIDRDHDDTDMFWLVVAHELGHLHGVEHHGGPECTMFWQHSEPAYQLTCE